MAEETGLQGELIGPLDEIEYWYVWDEEDGRVRVHKHVWFFLLRYVSGSTDGHDDEVDDARWFPIGEARERLTFQKERSVIARAAEAIERAENAR